MMTAQCQPCGCDDALCCSTVPVSPAEAERILAANGLQFGECFRTTNAGIYTDRQVIPSSNPRRTVSRCCLLDPISNLCSVYPQRPQICREYRCDV